MTSPAKRALIDYLAEHSRPDLAERLIHETIHDDNQRAVVPWADGTPPADLDEVRLVLEGMRLANGDDNPITDQQVDQVWEMWTPAKEGHLWWCSFTDATRPAGDQFLGACIVPSPIGPLAPQVAAELGCNPGGGVSIVGPFELTDEGCPFVVADVGRLLSKAEITERGLAEEQK